MPTLVQTDEVLCAELTRQHARTFSVASRFLPREKRRAAYAVYAFCRVADDMVDEASHGSRLAEIELERHRGALIAALHGQARTPLFRELMWAMHRYAIPAAPFHSLVNMLRTDLGDLEFVTWCELESYCGGVASTVGEMCAYVFGLPAAPEARAESLRCARILGVALQLTNILRDIGEDAARGRCYLPNDDLARFGIRREEVLQRTIVCSDRRWVQLMQFEVDRARALYALAEPGLLSLDRDAQCCATICSRGYAAILEAIERRRYDTLSGRAYLGTTRKAIVMFAAWSATRFSASATQGPRRAGASEQAMRA